MPAGNGKTRGPNGKSAAEDVASSVANFNPFAFLRTLKLMLLDQQQLADGVAVQVWGDALAPTKYFSASVAIFLAGTALFLHDSTSWSKTTSDLAVLFAFIVLPFLGAQYLYIRYCATVPVEGGTEGIAKLYQCYLYISGSVLALLGFAFLLMSSDPILDQFHIPPIAGLFVAVGILATPLAIGWILLVAPGRMLSAVFFLPVQQTYKAVWIGLLGILAVFILLGLLGFLTGR